MCQLHAHLRPDFSNDSFMLQRCQNNAAAMCHERIASRFALSESHLRGIIHEFLTYYHTERNHQGLDERIISPGFEVGKTAVQIVCRERLGGTLRYYYRRAA